MKRIDPRHLVQFHEIIRTGSFTRAAETLGLTQPALTRNMKVMEGRLGFEVLVRSRQGIVPTTIGVRILEEAASVVLAERRISALTNAIGTEQEAELRIGCTPEAGPHLLQRTVTEFARQCPMTRLDLRSAAAPALGRMLAKSDVDIVLGPLAIGDLWQGSQHQELCYVTLVIAAARTHPLATQARLDAADLADQSWAFFEAGSFLRAAGDAVLDGIGIDQTQPGAELPAAMLLPFLEMGEHLAVLPDFMLSADPGTGGGALQTEQRLVPLATGPLGAGFAFGAIWRSGTAPGKAARHFITLLESALRTRGQKASTGQRSGGPR